MRVTLLLAFTGCASLGYVKVDFRGLREDVQACQVDARRETAVCVDMTSFELEFNEHLKSMPEEEKQAVLFENSWNEGYNCHAASYGEFCEGP